MTTSLGFLAASTARAVDIVPYQATGWKYMQVGQSDALNGTFMGTGFDDSGWATGQAAFGGNSTTGPGFCAVQSTTHTSWNGVACGVDPLGHTRYCNTNMLLRRTFYAKSNVVVHVGIDNDVNIWVNGTFVGSFTHDNCATLDSYNVNVPDSYLTPNGGANLLAVQGIDRGGEDFLDVRVEGTVNNPPDCSNAAAAEAVIWPPNHTYHAVSITGVTDPDGDPVTITVTGVTQDEPVNGRGDGNTCPDAQIVDGQAAVRAERSGTPGTPGNGRVYAISFTASDGFGGTCTGTVNVCVPHDMDNPTCVDDGQKYNSLGSCTAANNLAPDAASLAVTRVASGEAEFSFGLPADSRVNVSVYDIVGRRIATLESGSLSAGTYTRVWNTNGVSKGLYFVRMHAGDATLTQRVLKLR